MTHNDTNKAVLKSILSNYVPKSLTDRPKSGFGAPINRWLTGVLKERLLEYSMKDFLSKQGIYDVDYTHSFITEYAEAGGGAPESGKHFSATVWNFYVFQQWYKRYFL